MIFYILMISSSYLDPNIEQEDYQYTLADFFSNWSFETKRQDNYNFNHSSYHLEDDDFSLIDLDAFKDEDIIRSVASNENILEDEVSNYSLTDIDSSKVELDLKCATNDEGSSIPSSPSTNSQCTPVHDNSSNSMNQFITLKNNLNEIKSTIHDQDLTSEQSIKAKPIKKVQGPRALRMDESFRKWDVTINSIKRWRALEGFNYLLKLPSYKQKFEKIKVLSDMKPFKNEFVSKNFIGDDSIEYFKLKDRIRNWKRVIKTAREDFILKFSNWIEKSFSDIKIARDAIEGLHLIDECLDFICDKFRYQMKYHLETKRFIFHHSTGSKQLIMLYKDIPLVGILDEIEYRVFNDLITCPQDFKKNKNLFKFGRKRLSIIVKNLKSYSYTLNKMASMVEQLNLK